MPYPSIVAFIVSEILASYGQTNMAGRSEHSNGHVKLDSASDPDQTIYTLWGRKRFPLTVTFGFLLPVIYHPTNLVYPLLYEKRV